MVFKITQLWGGKIFSVAPKYRISLPTTNQLCTNTIQGLGKTCPNDHIQPMSKNNVHFKVSLSALLLTNQGGTKDIHPENQTKKVIWKHLGDTQQSRLKDVRLQLEAQAESSHCLRYSLHKLLLYKTTQLGQILVYFCPNCGQRQAKYLLNHYDQQL